MTPGFTSNSRANSLMRILLRRFAPISPTDC
jgi:hypothetical protein